MSQHIGDRLPAPLRFDLGATPARGDTGRAVLLASVDDDGAPRIAILSPSEVTARDDRCLRLELREGTTTCDNLGARPKAALWCVLDAAAYTIKVTVGVSDLTAAAGWRIFDLSIDSVWRDFEASAPLISGPTYRSDAEACDGAC